MAFHSTSINLIRDNAFLRDYGIDEAKYNQIKNASSANEAKGLRSLWQKISDWFFGDRAMVYGHLNVLLRYSDEAEHDLDTTSKLITHFNRLRECCNYSHEDRLLLNVVHLDNDKFKVYFHIKGLETYPFKQSQIPEPVSDSLQPEPARTSMHSNPLYWTDSYRPQQFESLRASDFGTPREADIQKSYSDIISSAKEELRVLEGCYISRAYSPVDIEWNEVVRGRILKLYSNVTEQLRKQDTERSWNCNEVEKLLHKRPWYSKIV